MDQCSPFSKDMYWIYLFIFIFAVLTPRLIDGGVFFLPEEELETFAIFLLGISGFLLYIWQENQVRFQVHEKNRLQMEATRISKDLMDSYSYIGEINRKLDILKNIALGLPETDVFTPVKKQDVYDSIMKAIGVLSKAEDFALRFVNFETGQMEKEIVVGQPNFLSGVGQSAFADGGRMVYEFDHCLLVRSPQKMGAYAAFIIVNKEQNSVEDTEILKALASQALFLFALEKRQRVASPVS